MWFSQTQPDPRQWTQFSELMSRVRVSAQASVRACPSRSASTVPVSLVSGRRAP